MTSTGLKKRIHEVIFGTSTYWGQQFDLILIYTILVSVLVLMLESMEVVSTPYAYYLRIAEWVFTGLFTIEYALRVYCSPRRLRYIFSFYGMVDLISILPSYVALFLAGANYVLVIRLLRVLRVFRVLHLIRYMSEANVLMRAILSTRRKIFVFFVFVLVLSTLFGSLMYVVEGPERGYTSIPKSIYWTIVTITTVGYGDITPQTPIGQFIAAMAMLTGYSIIAVPTGILTAELSQEMQRQHKLVECANCRKAGHDRDAEYCNRCGHSLNQQSPDI